MVLTFDEKDWVINDTIYIGCYLISPRIKPKPKLTGILDPKWEKWYQEHTDVEEYQQWRLKIMLRNNHNNKFKHW